MSPMTKKELAVWLRDRVESLAEMDDDTTYHYKLDNDLAIYVGWGDGFDSDDECGIHSKKQPTYCICVKIAEYNPCDLTWDGAYMPWYTDDGEVYDTDTSISPNEDYGAFAEYILREYKKIRKLLDEEKLTFSN